MPSKKSNTESKANDANRIGASYPNSTNQGETMNNNTLNTISTSAVNHSTGEQVTVPFRMEVNETGRLIIAFGEGQSVYLQGKAAVRFANLCSDAMRQVYAVANESEMLYAPLTAEALRYRLSGPLGYVKGHKMSELINAGIALYNKEVVPTDVYKLELMGSKVTAYHEVYKEWTEDERGGYAQYERNVYRKFESIIDYNKAIEMGMRVKLDLSQNEVDYRLNCWNLFLAGDHDNLDDTVRTQVNKSETSRSMRRNFVRTEKEIENGQTPDIAVLAKAARMDEATVESFIGQRVCFFYGQQQDARIMEVRNEKDLAILLKVARERGLKLALYTE